MHAITHTVDALYEHYMRNYTIYYDTSKLQDLETIKCEARKYAVKHTAKQFDCTEEHVIMILRSEMGY